VVRKQRKTTRPPSSRHQLRVIGGSWRGRKLEVADVEGLRPTSDRIRETLFNWLAPEIGGARCLDLFAGSGALGLEALSRGAEHLVMVERDPVAVEMLKRNCSKLAVDAVDIVPADALSWLGSQAADHQFDVVFIDPPFTADLLQPCLELIADLALIKTGGLLYIETPATTLDPLAGQYGSLHRERFAGNVAYRLYRIT